jgi:hypothetical protein
MANPPLACRICGSIPLYGVKCGPNAGPRYTLKCHCGISWESDNMQKLLRAWASSNSGGPPLRGNVDPARLSSAQRKAQVVTLELIRTCLRPSPSPPDPSDPKRRSDGDQLEVVRHLPDKLDSR